MCHACLHFVLLMCAKFHLSVFKTVKEVHMHYATDQQFNGQTDRQGDPYIPQQSEIMSGTIFMCMVSINQLKFQSQIKETLPLYEVTSLKI